MKRRVKELLTNLCKTLGHDACEVIFQTDPLSMNVIVEGTCTRCNQKVGKTKIKYNEIAHYGPGDAMTRARRRLEKNSSR